LLPPVVIQLGVEHRLPQLLSFLEDRRLSLAVLCLPNFVFFLSGLARSWRNFEFFFCTRCRFSYTCVFPLERILLFVSSSACEFPHYNKHIPVLSLVFIFEQGIGAETFSSNAFALVLFFHQCNYSDLSIIVHLFPASGFSPNYAIFLSSAKLSILVSSVSAQLFEHFVLMCSLRSLCFKLFPASRIFLLSFVSPNSVSVFGASNFGLDSILYCGTLLSNLCPCRVSRLRVVSFITRRLYFKQLSSNPGRHLFSSILAVLRVALPSPAVFLPCPPQELGVWTDSSMPKASPLFHYQHISSDLIEVIELSLLASACMSMASLFSIFSISFCDDIG
jgi:hypothetical protein